MKTPIAVLLAALAAAPCVAADVKPQSSPAPRGSFKGSAREPNYKISFTMKVDDVEGAGRFLVEGGNQASYNFTGEPALVSNCIPIYMPNEENVRAECQFEMSGTSKGKPFRLQYSGVFVVRRGAPLSLIDEPTRKLEVMIEEVKLPK